MVFPSVSGEPSVTFSEEFERIFEEYRDLVYRTAYGITGSVQDAEDIAQSVFFRVLQGEIAVTLMKNPAGYLYRAAVNLSLTLVRSKQRVDVIVDTDAVTRIPQKPSDPAIDRHRELYEAIAKLPAKAAEIIILRYQHNMSDAKIATLLGTSRGVIAVTLYRARTRLRKLLVTTKEENR